MKVTAASVNCALALLVFALQPKEGVAADRLATIVVDAAAFLHDLPQYDIWIDGGSGSGGRRGDSPAQPGAGNDTATMGRRGGGVPGGAGLPSNLPSSDTLFNRCGVVLQSEANLYCVKEVPEAGNYHLFVRSQGTSRSSFRVSVNGKLTSEKFGKAAELTLASGGAFALEKGQVEILITRINQGAVFNALFLSKQADLKVADLAPLEFSGGQALLLKEYNVGRGTPKFGDVDGDGKMDLLVIGANGSATVYDHADQQLWSWEPTGPGPRLGGGFEPPGLVWDLDRDGRAEVVHWRVAGTQEQLVVADGLTGAVKQATDWPTPPPPHTYYNFRLAIGNLDGGYPDDVIVFTDPGDNHKSIAAYHPNLTKRWEHVEKLKKDHLGHYVYPRDVTGDGIDEIFVSALALDARGNKLWDRFDVFFDNHDHADTFRFVDLTGDGRPELICPFSDVGLVILDALTGKILWQRPAAHAQQGEAGNFLTDVPGPQIVVNGRFYANGADGSLSAQCFWFHPRGNLIRKWPSRPLAGNPDFVQGDWRGDGSQVLFWHKFKLNADGTGDQFFPDTVIHMFDFDGNGTDDVITRSPGGLRIYTCRNARSQPERVAKDPDVLRWKVTNHTHY